MSFSRHGEIYRPMRSSVPVPGRPSSDRPGLIGAMSFRLVIPWWVALPQSPPPLHQLARSLRQNPFAVQSKSSERQSVG